MKAIAIIADIINSRDIPERRTFQNNLKKTFAGLPPNPELVSPYAITLGDEFQALYKNAGGLFADIFQIMSRIRPTACRFSLGLGEITTRVNKESALGMDGSAFHLARDSMDKLKKDQLLFMISHKLE